MDTLVRDRVHTYYWDLDLNCATTTLRTMSEYFDLPLHTQVLDAAAGMHGAGGYRAQCGIVEGSLMFAGILGRHYRASEEEIAALCRHLAQHFEQQFSSLSCRRLRPQGFDPGLPPHLCQDLTVRGIIQNIGLLETWLKTRPQAPKEPEASQTIKNS